MATSFEEIAGYVIYLLESLGLLVWIQGFVIFMIALAMVRRLFAGGD